VVLRPTKIRALYSQMVGRVLRLSPETGKEDALILDFLWMTSKHDLARPASLVAKDESIASRIEKMMEDGQMLDILDAEEQAQRDALEERKRSLARQLAEQKTKQRKLVDPIYYGMLLDNDLLTDYEPIFEWEKAPVTPKQATALENCGIRVTEGMTKGYASKLLDVIMKRINAGLCTPKQMKTLERYGFVDVATWSKNEAGDMLTRLARNGWIVPNGVVPAKYKPADSMEVMRWEDFV
jgi:type I site-specific restriction endonuclease